MWPRHIKLGLSMRQLGYHAGGWRHLDVPSGGVLNDMVMPFVDYGLTPLVVFNGHTGNNALTDQTLRAIRRQHGVVVPWLNIWPMVPASVRERAHGENAPHASGHGLDPIGSVYEYLFPELTPRDPRGMRSRRRRCWGCRPVA